MTDPPLQPLSDIFSSKPQAGLSPRHTSTPPKSVTALDIAQVAQEVGEIENAPVPPKQYTDSGYHGSTEDEMEAHIPVPLLSSGPPKLVDRGLHEPPGDVVQHSAGPASAERRTTEGSFHSAREDVPAKVSFAIAGMKEDDGDISRQSERPNKETGLQTDLENLHDKEMGVGPVSVQGPDLVRELDEIGSPSDGSTPDRPLVRKSSLTFASLPAREPLTTKKSVGARESRTSHLGQAMHGSSNYFRKQTGASYLASTEFQRNGLVDQMMSDAEEHREVGTADDDRVAVQAHSKSSTQRLHEKIDMLGKAHTSRLSKSIPSAAALAASNLRKSEAAMKAEKEAAAVQASTETGVDEDEDWIRPLKTPEHDVRPPFTKSHTADVMEDVVGNETDGEEDDIEFDMRAPELIAHEERMRTPFGASPSPGRILPGLGHTKSASTATLASPGKQTMAPGPSHAKTISVSNPPFCSTTPKGSPRRVFDAPLSASKSKLQSIMKTAKGLFTSSAGVSAAAKVGTLSPKALQMAANNMPGLYPNITGMLEEDKPLPPSPPKEGRRTRSSTEREKGEQKKEREVRERQKAEDQLTRAREKEKQNAAVFKAEERVAQGRTSRPLQATRKSPRRPAEQHPEPERSADGHDMPPPAVPSLQSKAQRPVKPSRELPRKNRPQPMSIRVASTLSQRVPVSASSFASNLQQEALPPSNATQTVVSKKTSNTSLSSAASNAGFKSSVSSQSGKPRALLAAERKKEAEREAQRKLEQKRETERKRAEEARRQEQKQRVEAERKERERMAAEQAKKSAQQQAAEKRRQEQARKVEQQRIAHAANDQVCCLPNAPSPSSFFYGSSLTVSVIGVSDGVQCATAT